MSITIYSILRSYVKQNV